MGEIREEWSHMLRRKLGKTQPTSMTLEATSSCKFVLVGFRGKVLMIHFADFRISEVLRKNWRPVVRRRGICFSRSGCSGLQFVSCPSGPGGCVFVCFLKWLCLSLPVSQHACVCLNFLFPPFILSFPLICLAKFGRFFWPLLFVSSFVGWGGWLVSIPTLGLDHLETGVKFPKLKIAPSDLVYIFRFGNSVTTYYKHL